MYSIMHGMDLRMYSPAILTAWSRRAFFAEVSPSVLIRV